ncbi:MAG: DUF72 domain-containing protein [Candidatus Limnocylindrales bacterium]
MIPAAGRAVGAAAPAIARLYVGTSGFAYPGWAPTFYPPELRASDLLRFYAGRLSACELNATFYRQPTERTVAGWVAATPPSFRFVVKAQRGGSLQALLRDPAIAAGWLTSPYRTFGDRLGSVLFRIPGHVHRDDGRLAALIASWPPDLPLTVEAEDPSWAVDETFAALASIGAAWCSTDRDGEEPPAIRALGDWLYVRLRRMSYSPDELAGWAARLVPFLENGRAVYVFFRHDATGLSAVHAAAFPAIVAARIAVEGRAARPLEAMPDG